MSLHRSKHTPSIQKLCVEISAPSLGLQTHPVLVSPPTWLFISSPAFSRAAPQSSSPTFHGQILQRILLSQQGPVGFRAPVQGQYQEVLQHSIVEQYIFLSITKTSKTRNQTGLAPTLCAGGGAGCRSLSAAEPGLPGQDSQVGRVRCSMGHLPSAATPKSTSFTLQTLSEYEI